MNRTLENRTLRDYLRALNARRRLIIATTLVAALAALVVSLAQKPSYEATSTVSFTPGFFTQGGPDPVPGQTLEPRIAAGVQLVTRREVLSAVADEVGDGTTAQSLRGSIATIVDPTSNFVRIIVTADDAELAAKIANSVAAQVKEVGRSETREFYLDQALSQGDEDLLREARFVDPVEVVNDALAPEAPTSPKPARNTILAGFLGFVVGIVVALIRAALDRRITDQREIQRRLAYPIVGRLSADSLGSAGPSTVADVQLSEADLEAFRIMRANVEFMGKVDESVGSVAVTSPLADEGKSTVAAGYAYANALAGRRTVLIDCDFRRGVLAERFGVDPEPGLSEHIIGEATPKQVLRPTRIDGLAQEVMPLIPAGRSIRRPAEMIASDTFRTFLAQVSKVYELVVLDCPPLLPVGDTLEIIPQVESVLLCLRFGRTTLDQAQAAKECISHLPSKPTGIVLTGLGQGDADDYSGTYGSVERAATPVPFGSE